MSTLNLPCVRFVRQVSNGAARTKYSYQQMQSDLLAALRVAPWREAAAPLAAVTTVANKVSQTDAVRDEDGRVVTPSTFTAYLDDAFDAFKQGGDADPATATMCGYAGMVAYRFTLPADAPAISAVSLRATAARYLRSGLRVAAVLSSEAAPSGDWEVIRGQTPGAIASQSVPADPDVVTGVASWGFLGQPDASVLLESRAREGVLTLTAADFPALAATGSAYLWLYVSVEDYEDYWDLYDYKTPRYYSIEGSATLAAAACEVTFAADTAAPATVWTPARSAADDAWVLQSGSIGDKTVFTVPARTDVTNGDQAIEMFRSSIAPFDRLSSLEVALAVDLGGSAEVLWSDGVELSSSRRESVLARLSRYAEFPRVLAHDRPVSAAELYDTEYDWLTGAQSIPVSRLGVWGVNPPPVRIGTAPVGGWNFVCASLVSPLGLCGFGVGGRQYRLNEHRWTTSRVTCGSAPLVVDGYAVLTMRACLYAVPRGKPSYGRMLIRNRIVETEPQADWHVNVWRVTGADMLGPWRVQAAATLLSDPAIFSDGAASVSGSVTGEGTDVKGITLQARAQKIAVMSVGGGDLEVMLDGGVQPGDVVMLAPVIDRFHPSALLVMSDDMVQGVADQLSVDFVGFA